jgi:hypothetical protein
MTGLTFTMLAAELDPAGEAGRGMVEGNARWLVFFAIVIALLGLLAEAARGKVPDGAIGDAIKTPLIIGVLLGGGLWVIVTFVIRTGTALLEQLLAGISL